MSSSVTTTMFEAWIGRGSSLPSAVVIETPSMFTVPALVLTAAIFALIPVRPLACPSLFPLSRPLRSWGCRSRPLDLYLIPDPHCDGPDACRVLGHLSLDGL